MKDFIVKFVFVIVQAFIFYLGIFTDSVFIHEIRFFSILLSFLFAFLFFNSKRLWRYGRQFIIGGLLFSTAGDYFLTVVHEQYELGILLFFVAQYSYSLYLCQDLGCLQKMRYFGICMGMGLLANAITFLFIGKMIALIVLVLFYAAFFIGNIISVYRKPANNKLFTAGLTLFLLCDICVVLSNLGRYFPQIHFDQRICALVWVFYIPSQICIALSACQKTLEIE